MLGSSKPESLSGWAINVILALLAVAWFGLVASTWAEAAEESSETAPAEIPVVPGGAQSPSRDPSQDSSKGDSSSPSPDDEYSFNWLDPDKKIYVLQNRRYLKAGKLAVSVLGGIGFSNPYRTTLNIEPRVSFHVTEEWGLELFYSFTNNSTNTTISALAASSPNALPGIREIRSQYGAAVQFVPWYAKINVFNAILYFDWYFSLGGASITSYVNNPSLGNLGNNSALFTPQSLFGVVASTGHLYHLGQHLIFRIDVTGTYYNATINGSTGPSAWYSNYNFGVGLGWRL